MEKQTAKILKVISDLRKSLFINMCYRFQEDRDIDDQPGLSKGMRLLGLNELKFRSLYAELMEDEINKFTL
jgi:hypothetical protein